MNSRVILRTMHQRKSGCGGFVTKTKQCENEKEASISQELTSTSFEAWLNNSTVGRMITI